MWGYIASNRVDVVNECMDLLAMRGGALDGRRAEAILDGLDAAKHRFETRCRSAQVIVDFLLRHPRVSEVFHPSVPDHPDRDVIERSYAHGGSLVSFRVAGADNARTRHFCDVVAMTGVPRYALSFDGLVTKLNHHRSVSEYFTAPADVERMGVDRLVRLGVGLEEPVDLIACLNWALWRYEAISEGDVQRWQARRAQELGVAGNGGDDVST